MLKGNFCNHSKTLVSNQKKGTGKFAQKFGFSKYISKKKKNKYRQVGGGGQRYTLPQYLR